MAPQISDLKLYYLHKELTVNEQASSVLTCTSNGTTTTVTCNTLTQANDYWNGALLYWITGRNTGLYFGIKDFAAGTLTTDFKMPVASSSGDTFRLFLGGKFISSNRINGLLTTQPQNVTGVSISYASMIQNVGSGVIKYYSTKGKITWTSPDETEGDGVIITSLNTGESVAVFSGGGTELEKSKFIEVTRTSGSLPTNYAEDAITLALNRFDFLPPVIGEESLAGKTFYKAIGIKNTSNETIYNVEVGLPSPPGSATTLAAKLELVDTLLYGTSFYGWDTSGFILNLTKNDCRYYYRKSGNVLTIQNPVGGIRGCVAKVWNKNDSLFPMPLIDIGLDSGTSVFENPVNETTAPNNVIFSAPVDTYLNIGDLPANALRVIWEKVFIPVDMYPVKDAKPTIRLYAQMETLS